jgi:hypothetical protein
MILSISSFSKKTLIQKETNRAFKNNYKLITVTTEIYRNGKLQKIFKLCVRNVVCMGEMRNAYKVLVGKT